MDRGFLWLEASLVALDMYGIPVLARLAFDEEEDGAANLVGLFPDFVGVKASGACQIGWERLSLRYNRSKTDVLVLLDRAH